MALISLSMSIKTIFLRADIDRERKNKLKNPKKISINYPRLKSIKNNQKSKSWCLAPHFFDL